MTFDEASAKAKLAYLRRRLQRRYFRKKPTAQIFKDIEAIRDDSLTESVSEKILKKFSLGESSRNTRRRNKEKLLAYDAGLDYTHDFEKRLPNHGPIIKRRSRAERSGKYVSIFEKKSKGKDVEIPKVHTDSRADAILRRFKKMCVPARPLLNASAIAEG
jgi:hypothetical protein